MSGSYANSLIQEDGDAFLLESRRELCLQAVVAVTQKTSVRFKLDVVRASGDDTPVDEIAADTTTDDGLGDDGIILEGATVLMSQISANGGFINQATLPRFSRGLAGGPYFNTVVQETADGEEIRISKWQRPKRVFDIASAIDTREDFRALMAHYKQVRGSLSGFRMRDPFDWSTHPYHMLRPDPNDMAHRELIGAGDGTTKVYQLCKRYKVGNLERVRPITHPQFRGSENDDGPVPPALISAGDPTDFVNEIFVDDAKQTEGTHYSWVWNGGQIEFATAPAKGTAIYWCGTFDVPVRFDQQIDQGLLADMATDTSFRVSLTATEISVPEPFSDHKYMGGAFVGNISQDTAIDLGRGRFYAVTATTSGLKMYLPATKNLLDGGIIATVLNEGANSIDLFNYELSTSKLTTLTQGQHAHLVLMNDGTIRGIV